MTNHLKLALIAATVSLLAPPAQAHRAWLLPSATVLSGPDLWVTVDGAISNDLFYFEHNPLPLDQLAIEGPDGKAVTPENLAKGRFRSTVDFKLAQPGTYKLSLTHQGLFASYKLDGENKRWRGMPDELAKAIPAKATDVKVTENRSRIETFVTSGKPSSDTLKPTGVGLEMIPVTHPNNLAVGEKATFRLVLDGKPAGNVAVEIVPGGIRYRDTLNDSKATTDETGTFSVTFPDPGFYWVKASVQDDKSTIKDAQQRRSTYITTVEVLPQ